MERSSDLSRLLDKVQMAENDCWIWTGSVFRVSGYGAFRLEDGTWLAHRASFYLHGKGHPGDMFVCHHCDNRLCVNPDHLFLGTNRDNVDDMVTKGRQCRHQPRVDAALSAKRVALRKLNEKQVMEILERLDAGESRFDIAPDYKIHFDTIYKIMKGDTWSHITGIPCRRHTWNQETPT